MIIDFTEIPKANTGNGNQDTFELFCRDFLEILGYEIVSGPGRGADQGKDLIVREKQGDSYFDWLVSCKHYAHTGSSVTPKIEINIYERVDMHNCHGFMGFYSTIPSSGLVTMLEGLTKIKVQIFDNEKIESKLLENSQCRYLILLARYFPSSYSHWVELMAAGNNIPTKLFEWFLKTNYAGFDGFFDTVFGSLGTSIKAIKTADTFEHLMENAGIKFLHEERLDDNSFPMGMNTAKELIAHLKTKQYSILDIESKLIPAEFKSPNIEKSKLLITHTIYTPASSSGKPLFKVEGNSKPFAQYYLYDTHLLCNKHAYEMFHNIFKDIKEIIK